MLSSCPLQPTVFQSWGFDAEMSSVVLDSILCLRAKDSATVTIAPCEPGDSGQRWAYYKSGQVVSDEGWCLVVADTDDAAGAVTLDVCLEGGAGQRWALNAAHEDRLRGIPPLPSSDAPVLDFYMYRATSDVVPKYAFGEINTGNMDGVMWYLMNEVVTNYTAAVRCPRKFNISMIQRYRVHTKATAPLLADGMNFGVRWAYDRGQCTGRCFPGNQCTCGQDCQEHFDRYGYFVGCNKFVDEYPFPTGWTPAPGGIWYSLPLGGRCEFPTGERNCTWSYELAGSITLQELEEVSPGLGDCCTRSRSGNCTSFWEDQFSIDRTYWRINQALDLFARKYPEKPRDLPATCDFRNWTWYADDGWPRKDPWASDCLEARPAAFSP